METDYKEIFEKLEELERFLHRERRRHGHGPGSEGKHAGGQARVLAMLKIQAEMTAKDLSYLLGIRQQSLNELLKKLESSEYIERQPSDQDRRVMIIRLTEKGKEYQQPQDDFSDLFVRFSQEELAQFDQYLDRLLETAQSLQPDGEESDEKRRREWMKNARSRMGDARFEQLCAMHPRPFGPAPDHGRSHGCPEEGFGPADFGPKGFGPRGYGPEDFGPKGFGPRGYGPEDFGPKGFGPRDCGPADFDPGDFGPAGFGPMGGRPRPHEPGRSMDWENAGKPGLKDHGHGCYHSKSGCEKTVETDERPGHHYFKGRRAESEEETELQAKPVQEADEKNSVNDKIQSQETEAKQSE